MKKLNFSQDLNFEFLSSTLLSVPASAFLSTSSKYQQASFSIASRNLRYLS